MKTVRMSPSPSQPRDVALERRGAAVTQGARRRERDFGVGYGKSSGYASPDRRYAPAFRQPSFRFA